MKITGKNITVAILSVLAIAYMVTVSVALCERESHYDVYEEMNKLHYSDVKYLLVHEVDSYIKAKSPQSNLNGIRVVESCIEYDIDICFVLAQAQIESNFGTSGLARKTNSVWNVYAFDGHKYDQISNKGKYKNADDSIEPYLKLLRSNYMTNGKTEFDLMDKYVNSSDKRYASDTNYESRLTSVFSSIRSNTCIDSLSMELKRLNVMIEY